MLERDFESFSSMLDDLAAFYPQAKDPTPGQKAIFFRALSDYTIAQVRSGFDAHLRDAVRGRFFPLPADVIAQIDGTAKADGRPGPEEAWAIAIQAADEGATIFWTNEIAVAWGIAFPVFQRGDEVGARMAFKDAYTRVVAKARGEGAAVAWVPSIGEDPARRDEALARGHSAGLLAAPERLRELPSPHHALSATNNRMPENVRIRLSKLREALVSNRGESE